MKKQENTNLKVAAVVALVAAVLLVGPNLTGYVTAATPTSSGSNYVEMYLELASFPTPIGNSGYSIKIIPTPSNYGINTSLCSYNITKNGFVVSVTSKTTQPTKYLNPSGGNDAIYLHLDAIIQPSSVYPNKLCKISAFVGPKYEAIR